MKIIKQNKLFLIMGRAGCLDFGTLILLKKLTVKLPSQAVLRRDRECQIGPKGN
jgi:hypothetical protein